ncbi:unnamed protein product [Boreogadus saida]
MKDAAKKENKAEEKRGPRGPTEEQEAVFAVLRLTPPVISSESTTPRSFVIRTQHGAELRRNRRHLQPGPVPQPIPAAHRDVTGTDTHSDGATMSETVPVSQSVATPTTPLPGQTVTRSGRVCKQIDRLDL